MKIEDQNPSIINNLNFELKQSHMNPGGGISLTIPDQTMTIRELITRYAQGLPITGNPSQPQYDENPILDGVNFKTLDLTEQKEVEKQVFEELQALETKKRDEDTKKKKEALKSQIKAEIEAEEKLKKSTESKPADNQ